MIGEKKSKMSLEGAMVSISSKKQISQHPLSSDDALVLAIMAVTTAVRRSIAPTLMPTVNFQQVGSTKLLQKTTELDQLQTQLAGCAGQPEPLQTCLLV